MAQSDVLILLDCCWSGVANETEGNGITELLCACPFNTRANGVGHYSFTQALATELRLLSKVPCFSIGKLYTAIYTRMQSFLTQGIDNERYPAPVHFVLSQDGPHLRGIQLAVKKPKRASSLERHPSNNSLSEDQRYQKRFRQDDPPDNSNKKLKSSNFLKPKGGNSLHGGMLEAGKQNPGTLSAPEVNDLPYGEEGPDDNSEDNHEEEGSDAESQRPISKDSLYPRDAPRALFAIRFKEDIQGKDLSVELFREWLRSIPAAAEEIRIEAGFKCFSTVVLLTVPCPMGAYIPQHLAVLPLGLVKSSIILPSRELATSPVIEESDLHSTSSKMWGKQRVSEPPSLGFDAADSSYETQTQTQQFNFGPSGEVTGIRAAQTASLVTRVGELEESMRRTEERMLDTEKRMREMATEQVDMANNQEKRAIELLERKSKGFEESMGRVDAFVRDTDKTMREMERTQAKTAYEVEKLAEALRKATATLSTVTASMGMFGKKSVSS